ncbi:alpha/beta hydrolase [Microbacterium sp. No. 7]|uniref:alpha/beta hydrolase n=1 Tax=Microbacterium sp. No. 7 TaxID=1714373 RepID=UPI0006D164D9|nr:alpha/beta hydrolase [Microbacterium sp. No. 7]ALJ18714.1 lipase [Microbacterium sp. No. 7]
MTETPRPPFDREMEPVLPAIHAMIPASVTADMIPALRATPIAPLTAEVLAAAGIESRDVTIASYDGAEIVLSVMQPVGRTGTGPGFYHTHGGGMIIYDRFNGVTDVFDWLHRYNGVVVTVEYRLAPEHPDPTPVEDGYAGLVWTAGNAEELGIDRLVLIGASAGGGLAAGLALLARDRGGPRAVAQILRYPMLDDRDDTVSKRQIDGVGVWDRVSNVTGWAALLGDRVETDDVSVYAAPARADDLSGLPPAYIDCGSADSLRDESVAFASRIWASGGEAELHIWPGGFHAFERLAPNARISATSKATRDAWLERVLTAPGA